MELKLLTKPRNVILRSSGKIIFNLDQRVNGFINITSLQRKDYLEKLIGAANVAPIIGFESIFRILCCQEAF